MQIRETLPDPMIIWIVVRGFFGDLNSLRRIRFRRELAVQSIEHLASANGIVKVANLRKLRVLSRMGVKKLPCTPGSALLQDPLPFRHSRCNVLELLLF